MLRLADARFLNDRTERSYGVRAICEFLDGELSAAKPKVSAEVINHILRELKEPPAANLFVCSFSERNGTMSQWERYAARGFGYCLGFDRKRLESFLAKTDVELRQLVYSRKDQRQAFRAKLDELTRELELTAENTAALTPTKLDVWATAIAVDLEELSLQLKTPDFRDEKEWRLIREVRNSKSDQRPSQRPIFAPRGGLVKPYLELRFGKPDTMSCLPLVSLICGPKLESEVSVASAEYFLAQHGYLDVDVTQSKLHAVWR